MAVSDIITRLSYNPTDISAHTYTEFVTIESQNIVDVAEIRVACSIIEQMEELWESKERRVMDLQSSSVDNNTFEVNGVNYAARELGYLDDEISEVCKLLSKIDTGDIINSAINSRKNKLQQIRSKLEGELEKWTEECKKCDQNINYWQSQSESIIGDISIYSKIQYYENRKKEYNINISKIMLDMSRLDRLEGGETNG